MEEYVEIFRRWLDVEKGYSLNTLDGYLRDLQEFRATIPAGISIHEVTSNHIRSFVVGLYGNNTAALSRNRAATAGRQCSWPEWTGLLVWTPYCWMTAAGE